LEKVAHSVAFANLPETFLPLLQGQSTGRTVIRFAAAG